MLIKAYFLVQYTGHLLNLDIFNTVDLIVA